MAHLLLAPVWTLDEAVQVICRDGKPEPLLADLALHELGAILADAPLGPTSHVRAFSHLIRRGSDRMVRRSRAGGALPAAVSDARERGADLIVIGTHGRHGMAHLLLGSVAERAVRTAPCPVLTVRGPKAP